MGVKEKTARSWLRLMVRSIWSPQTWSVSVLKRSWLKGMRISTNQPSSVTEVATSQTGSQEPSPRPSPLPPPKMPEPPLRTSSRFIPEGLVEKRYAVR